MENNLQNQKILNYLNKSWIILGVNFFLLGLVSLLFSYFVDSDAWHLHGLFCILSTIVIFIFFFKNLKLHTKIFFFDLRYMLALSFWFYFIFGSSVLVFGNQDIIDLSMTYYYVDLNLALKANSMNAIGFSIVIIIISVFRINWPIKIISILKKDIKYFDPMGHRLLLIIFFICIFSFLNTTFENFGYIEKGMFSSISLILKHLGLSFYLTSIYYKGYYRRFINIASFFYVFFYILTGIIFLNKSEILAPLLLILVKYSCKKKSFKLIIISFLILLFLLQVFGNYTRNLREEHFYSNTINSDLLKKSLFSNKLTDSYIVWRRLNYINSQGAAINFYDNNNGGESLKNILWVFIPRFLNKDKPNINEFTGDFFNKITGLKGTSDSPGIFIEGYYNFGWIGLLTSSLLAGLTITIYKTMIYETIRNKLYSLYFLIFSGLWMCFRIDGMILSDYLGKLIFTFYLLIFLIFLLLMLRILIKYKKFI